MNSSRPSSEKHLLAVYGSNAETHHWTVCREWETLEPAVLSGWFSSDSFLQGSGVMWKGRMECKTQRWWMTPEETMSSRCKTGALMKSQRLWQYTQDLRRFKPVGAQHWEGESKHGVPSPTKKLSAVDTHGQWKRKSVFSNGVSLGILLTLWGRPHAQE